MPEPIRDVEPRHGAQISPPPSPGRGEDEESTVMNFIVPGGIKQHRARPACVRMAMYMVVPSMFWFYYFLAFELDEKTLALTSLVCLITSLAGVFVELIRLRRWIPLHFRSVLVPTVIAQFLLLFVCFPNLVAHLRSSSEAIPTRSIQDLLAELNAAKDRLNLGKNLSDLRNFAGQAAPLAPAAAVHVALNMDEDPLPALPDDGRSPYGSNPRLAWDDPTAFMWMAGRKMDRMHPAPVKPAVPLTTLSIVIISFDEHDYVERTLKSVYEETEAAALLEIILVDDHSSPPLVEDFNMADFPEGLVKVIRNEERVGLIQSRATGANAAKGDIVVFFDCHVKPVKNWEMQIMERINNNYKHVVVPAIPVLDGDTWLQKGAAVGYKMMMEWDLNFHWFEDGTDDVPIMSGGLLAISSQWWHESGEYDLGMIQWGGENIEQSLRIWLCGGEISVARDSLVMHMFRKKFPYKLDGGSVGKNKDRTVALWFGDFVPHYLKKKNKKLDAFMDQYTPILADRFELKKQNDCMDIKWWTERFREVLVTREMAPALQFQLRVSASGSGPVPVVVPDFPAPPSMGPSEVGEPTYSGLCAIPTGSLDNYFSNVETDRIGSLNANGTIPKDSDYYQFIQSGTKADWDRLKADAKTRNVDAGLTTVPCAASNKALMWRQAGDDMNSIKFVGQNPNDPQHKKCLQMSDNTLNTNVIMTNCKYNVWNKEHSKRLVTDQAFQLVTGVNHWVSDTEKKEDYEQFKLVLNNPGKKMSCLGASVIYDWTDLTSLKLPVLTNTECDESSDLIRWGQANSLWDLESLKGAKEAEIVKSNLRGA